ncbi:hypothetical protein IFM89_001427 [Coptis chinensis]|uniref:gibberellin 2beta-dioxygenase n=1 Tax=Coptis chinensis TaxID=261450 RepID=A0A835LD35_9MAGN|nr:hypothetical protein IFM89_001427 [Coptis chinensis]
MVVPSPTTNGSNQNKGLGVPIIDLSRKRSRVSELIVKACEEYGFFKVINHGVSKEIIANMEKEGLDFFAKPSLEKHKAGPPNPLGYGIKSIGFNGDMGEVEYLLLQTNSLSISQRSKFISEDPARFNFLVSDYVQAIRNLACELLDLMAEGLGVQDKSVFSRLIRDVDSDSLIRLNHYPSCEDSMDWSSSQSFHQNRIGFGEHSDPQMLTLLRSNDVGGLQVSMDNGVWVPISPDPTAFCVNVGDALQALTNGKFTSARHRVLVNSFKSRMSMVYFGAPPLQAWISPLSELVTAQNPCLYRPFTWEEYKKTTYSLRLGDSRLDLFKTQGRDEFDTRAVFEVNVL